MPCYFVSNGLEMQMANETFDLLWNSFPHAELTDSETSSSFGEGDKVTSSVEKPESTGWRKQDDGYYNNKPNDSNYFKKYYQQKTKQRMWFYSKLQVKLGKAQENEEVPEVLGVSSL